MHPLPLRVRKQLVLASSSTLEIARRARFPHVTAAAVRSELVLRDLHPPARPCKSARVATQRISEHLLCALVLYRIDPSPGRIPAESVATQ